VIVLTGFTTASGSLGDLDFTYEIEWYVPDLQISGPAAQSKTVDGFVETLDQAVADTPNIGIFTATSDQPGNSGSIGRAPYVANYNGFTIPFDDIAPRTYAAFLACTGTTFVGTAGLVAIDGTAATIAVIQANTSASTQREILEMVVVTTPSVGIPGMGFFGYQLTSFATTTSEHYLFASATVGWTAEEMRQLGISDPSVLPEDYDLWLSQRGPVIHVGPHDSPAKQIAMKEAAIRDYKRPPLRSRVPVTMEQRLEELWARLEPDKEERARGPSSHWRP